MNGPTALATAIKSGALGSIFDLARRDALDAARCAELENDLLAVVGRRASTGEGVPPQLGEVRCPNRRVEGGQRLGGNDPQVVRRLGGLADPTIALDDDGHAARTIWAQPAARLDGH